MPVSGPLHNPSLITSEKTNSMQNTLKYFFVLLLILFQPGMETAHAAKPIFPSSIQKIKRDKKADLPKKNKLRKTEFDPHRLRIPGSIDPLCWISQSPFDRWWNYMWDHCTHPNQTK